MSVIGLEEDELDFISSIPCSHPCEVKNGCLHFSYVFETEQEYGIRFREKGTKQLTKLYMYAVEEDLWSLRPLKGDLHTHSYYSDGEDGIPMTPANYREQGFDFFSLTDHNRMFTSELAAELYEDIPLGMNIIRGEEIHTPDSQLHIINVGGQSSVCDRYIRYEAEFEAEVADIERTLTHIPKQYRYRVASAKWACNEIHKCGGIAIFAHPYWKPRRYNITKEFADYLFEENIFENRYRHVDELTRMGASVQVSGRVAVVTGREALHGAAVRCTDLRGGAALCVAALAADGMTEVSDISHIDRGYEDIVRDLKHLGGDIRRTE
jgi:predicted metal-dependent phosphoesterase TrpH